MGYLVQSWATVWCDRLRVTKKDAIVGNSTCDCRNPLAVPRTSPRIRRNVWAAIKCSRYTESSVGATLAHIALLLDESPFHVRCNTFPGTRERSQVVAQARGSLCAADARVAWYQAVNECAPPISHLRRLVSAVAEVFHYGAIRGRVGTCEHLFRSSLLAAPHLGRMPHLVLPLGSESSPSIMPTGKAVTAVQWVPLPMPDGEERMSGVE